MTVLRQAPSRTVVVASPLGDLTLVQESGKLVRLNLMRPRPAPTNSTLAPRYTGRGEAPVTELGEYFAGTRRRFTVPFRVIGSDFDRRVWSLAAAIPYGETTTYGALARRMDDGTTAQEVGAALGRNPLCVVIPCHRVVGAAGRLTGYAGGLHRKRFLLDLEQRVAGNPGRLF
jgi:methylated-DNA-[protein]-cysteine S-methyltransferase